MEPDNVPRGLRTSAAYGWRILVLCAAGYLVLNVLGQLEFVVVAIFVGLVIAAICSPIVKFFDKFLPRPIAVALGLLVLLLVIIGIFGFIGGSVAGEWGTLNTQFSGGIDQIKNWLGGAPFHVHSEDFQQWYENGKNWFEEHRGDLAQGALGGAGAVIEVLTGLALAVFCAVCFLSGGGNIWNFIVNLFPHTSRGRIDGAGHVAWRSFAGYTRGIIIVAASNAVIVCVILLILRVPLAVPLALLVFFGTFIPLIGAPVAMFTAVIVALAARGPLIALLVLLGIALVGQIEGNVLQPLVMSKAVNIHPLAVALAVVAGGILGGLIGAVIAVPVVSVIYGVLRFWFQTAPPNIPPGTGDDGLSARVDPPDSPPLEREPLPI